MYIKKEDSAVPTVALAALFLSCIQDSTEGEYFVVTADIPGAFLQTDQPDDDEVVVQFDGPMVEGLIQRFTRRRSEFSAMAIRCYTVRQRKQSMV